ncbi:MAG TPA: putative glycolipid-binding domain-containing protein, partial [Chitinophagaceae bacterium]|nr:putative glycolipid-binding domain-containing protein [Chitinophagaceae bacterium]
MQTNILWTGREYYSLENCLVHSSEEGAEINSVIVGTYQSKIYRVEYQIKTNTNWETIFAEIKSRHSNKIEYLKLESDGKGNWFTNNKKVDQYNGCIDIDIPLTPFTNTLPIKRLNLTQGQEQQIRVIYIDILEGQIKPVRQ